MGGAAGGNTRPGGAMPDNNPLSARETEILQLLAKGMSFNEIGEILGISPHTVTAHIKKIYRKLAVHSRGEAVYEATQMGLLRG
jgi:DNA-binding CsgD family transcriptional regulator